MPHMQQSFPEVFTLRQSGQGECTLPKMPGSGKTPADVAIPTAENEFFHQPAQSPPRGTGTLLPEAV